VQMGDKNFIEFPGMMIGLQELVLRAFAAVKQPHLRDGWLLQIQQYRRHITVSGWHACGCPEKNQFHNALTLTRLIRQTV
jgi:hypothetical protein